MVTRTLLRASALSLITLAVLARRGESHALHVSYADVSVANGEAHVALRAYTDDLARAAGGAARAPAYVVAHFALAMPNGARIALATCGTTTQGDMTHLCLRAPLTAANLRGARLTNDVLLAEYSDQVNVVRIDAGRTLLFTRARRVQPL